MILTVLDEKGTALVEAKREVTHIKSNVLPDFSEKDIEAAGVVIHKLYIAGESYKGGLVVVIHAFIAMDDGSTDDLISMTMCDTYGNISGYKHIVNGEKVKLRKAMGIDCLAERYGPLRIAMLKKAMANYRRENKLKNNNELTAEIIVETRVLAHLYQEIEMAKENIKVKVGIVNESNKEPSNFLK